MNDHDQPAAPESSQTLAMMVQLWLGLLVFGVLNFCVQLGLSSSGLSSWISSIIALAVVIFAALGFRRRMLAAGSAVGYVLLAIVSGGACVGFSTYIPNVFNGFFLYILALVLGVIGLGALSIIESKRPG